MKFTVDLEDRAGVDRMRLNGISKKGLPLQLEEPGYNGGLSRE